MQEDKTHIQLFKKLQEYISEVYRGTFNINLQFIDVNSAESMDYLNDMSNIMENNLGLPYVSLNNIPLIWGSNNLETIIDKLLKKLS